ncbi:MAG: hypothetical protein KatS3mg017_0921 [Fimbriimonadales bacterium]|nr:MAG: hypothetical protein KatS3mg017_0921 [Fimbriimonadales bacterium]
MHQLARKRWGYLSLIAVLLSGCHLSKSSQIDGRIVSFDVDPRGSRIVFVGAGKGITDLYLLDIPTKTVKRLTQSDLEEREPVFSPDGRYVVFSAGKPSQEQTAAWHLFVMDVNTKKIKQLTSGNSADSPCWFTTEGKYLVFTRSEKSRPYSMGGQIWVQGNVYISEFMGMEKGLSALQKLPLRYCAGKPRLDGIMVTDGVLVSPFPPGSLVEFNLNTWLKKRNGQTRQTALTQAISEKFGAEIYDSCWVQNDSQLVFIASNADYHYEVWTVHAQGTGLRQLTNLRTYIEDLRIPIVGEHCYFLKLERNGRWMKKGIWRASLKDGTVEQVADSKLFDAPLDWKP